MKAALKKDGGLFGKAEAFRVVFLPQWYTNPYQRLLDEHLAALGVNVARFPQNVPSIVRGLWRTRPHVLHLHWLHPFYETSRKRQSWPRLFFSLSAFALLKMLGVRIVWTAHNLEHHEAGGRLVDRFCTHWVARRAHAIIVHSESAGRRLRKKFPLTAPERITVIPHGHYIDCYDNRMDRAEARRRLHLAVDDTVFLFFGQIRPYKGVLELVEAFRNLNDRARPGEPTGTRAPARADAPDRARQPSTQEGAGSAHAHLLIAGRPLTDDAAQVIHRAVANAPNITFSPGFVPDDDVQVYMNAADAVVLPYRNVLTSGAALLAMSFARACVAPRSGYFAEVLDDEGAFLYDPDEPDGLVMAMREAVARRDELADMGAHNHGLAQALDWGDIAERTLAVYDRARRAGWFRRPPGAG